MTIGEIISNIGEQNEEALIFAKKIDGKFLSSSEAILVELTDEEKGLPTNEIAKKYCPEFDYFLEVFLVNDILQDLNKAIGFKSLEKQVDSIIHFAEFDSWCLLLFITNPKHIKAFPIESITLGLFQIAKGKKL